MGLVLWIDQNTFATSLLEKVFKKKGMPFYTISNANDFVYLVDDLRPELIVVDAKTASDSMSEFKAQYDGSEFFRGLPFVILEDNEQLGFIENVVGKISRPFDPFEIPSILNKLKNAN